MPDVYSARPIKRLGNSPVSSGVIPRSLGFDESRVISRIDGNPAFDDERKQTAPALCTAIPSP